MNTAPKEARRTPEERINVTLHGKHQDGQWVEMIEVRQEMDGELEGFTAVIPLEMRDGRVWMDGDIRWEHEPMPLDRMASRVLRDLRHGDLIGTVLVCLERMGGIALPWINAIAAERKRPGRAGTPPIQLAEIAAKRVEADERWPGKAIRNMAREWPDLFVSESAAHAKVHRAMHAKGGAMLERDDGMWQLTDRAVELLRDTRGDTT